jgi:hypothetical protein
MKDTITNEILFYVFGTLVLLGAFIIGFIIG